jgi:hypothetical protein
VASFRMRKFQGFPAFGTRKKHPSLEDWRRSLRSPEGYLVSIGCYRAVTTLCMTHWEGSYCTFNAVVVIEQSRQYNKGWQASSTVTLEEGCSAKPLSPPSPHFSDSSGSQGFKSQSLVPPLQLTGQNVVKTEAAINAERGSVPATSSSTRTVATASRLGARSRCPAPTAVNGASHAQPTGSSLRGPTASVNQP